MLRGYVTKSIVTLVVLSKDNRKYDENIQLHESYAAG